MIDPTLIPHSDKTRRLLASIERRGLTLRRLRPDSDAVVLIGPSVEVRASALHELSKEDIRSVAPDYKPRYGFR